MFKKLIENKKAVIFDLDGTLVESEGLWTEAMEKIYRLNGGRGEFKQNAGVSIIEQWRVFKDRDQVNDQHTAGELAEQTHNEFIKLLHVKGIDVVEGFWPLAAELKVDRGLKLGLTTNTVKKVAMEILKTLNLEQTFDAMLFLDDVKHAKPDPEIYNKTVKMLGVKKKEVLVFEDSVAGTTSAFKAGLDTVVIYNGQIPESKYPLGVKSFLPSFIGLPGNLDKDFWEVVRDYAKNLAEKQNKSTKLP